MPRTLRPGQRAQLFVVDIATGATHLVYESATLLFEAPNWTPDGRWLVINGDGRLFRLAPDAAPDTAQLVEIDLAGLPPLNNDHVLSPDGATVYASAEDGHIYAVPFAGGSHRRVTNDLGGEHGHHLHGHYLHGVSPDGAELAYIGMEITADAVRTHVFTIPSAGGEDRQLTDLDSPHDGSEYSPDGEWIYFNAERASVTPGHAQVFRMRRDGSGVEQLTFDERVNWFPHVSPDGAHLAYLSYPSGTLGHPADCDVVIRLATPEGRDPRDLVRLFGGQGTLNVPSWSPDSTQLAYVAYPLD